MKDRLGLAFFTFAAVISILAAWENPALLSWLAAAHNALLAVLYARRKPAVAYDRLGLWLGLLAAILPFAAPSPHKVPMPCLVLGATGYALIFWSLLCLGNRFGIAPADRGLVVRGPYRLIRHPMYLGELALRAALVISSPQLFLSLGMLVILCLIQAIRATREERIIKDYSDYASRVTFRLLPGVW